VAAKPTQKDSVWRRKRNQAASEVSRMRRTQEESEVVDEEPEVV
jgi:hypothetical protein